MMADRKNVLFIGMTQNGKSSLVQQILQYGGDFGKASAVGIGTGNSSETQECARYSVDVPLKSHRLRQVQGPNEERDGELLEPGIDFEPDNVDDFTFLEEVNDSGKRLQLLLIDTPGLSDSGNDASSMSMSGMRVIDERHKLRILLALQDVEDVHAICFVVRRDTNYGGDFQELIRRVTSLLGFCNRGPTWNLQYHIIHTNITPEDRTADRYEDRQQEFDKFGPGGATHHFLDNRPDPDFPLDIFFTNFALSKLFESLESSKAVRFSDLHYPKSPESKNNDQELISTAQRAGFELQEMVEGWSATADNLKKEVARHDEVMKSSQRRIDDYDDKINQLDQDFDSEIDGQEGSTGFNIIGGAHRLFHFHSELPITKVDLWHNERGYWKDVEQTTHTYRATLEPHWFNEAYGKVTLFVKKKDKHSAEISELRKDKEQYVTRWETFKAKIFEATQRIAIDEENIRTAQEQIAALQQDVATLQASKHSISLVQTKGLVKFFTVDSPLAVAAGYQICTTVPWMVPSLQRLGISSLQSEARAAIEEKTNTARNIEGDLEKAEALLACLSAPEGLSIGAFATLLRAQRRSDEAVFKLFCLDFEHVRNMEGINFCCSMNREK